MKIFLTRIFRFAIAPIIFVIFWALLYVFLDPYKIIWNYKTFDDDNAKAYVFLNKDYVSTKLFDNNYKKYSYNSFIFGNSRSIFYKISDWENHIGVKNSAFHFDASGEALYSLHKKLLYIDSKKLKIDNVLLVLDYSLLGKDQPNEGPLGEISPQLENNKNLLSFHFTYFKAFTLPSFFIPFIYYKTTNNVPTFMKNVLDDRQRSVDPITNEIQFKVFEKMIDSGKYYTKERMSPFYERKKIETFSEEMILDKQKVMLKEINAIFLKNNANFKIIISPLYDQIKLNKTDLEYLKTLFGEKNVFDFSGINKFTNDYRNYYEDSHYRPHVAREILQIVYQ